MKHLTLDVENTVVKRNGKMHLDPFEPENTLVMVGMLDDLGNQDIVTFDHAEQQPTTEGRLIVQQKLDDTALLIMHNAAHDLLWLWESGFTYDGPIFDTMLGEYVLQRGQKEPLSLDACAERYNLDTQKQDTLKEYFKQGTQYVTFHMQSCQSTCHMTYMPHSNCIFVCRHHTRNALHWTERYD